MKEKTARTVNGEPVRVLLPESAEDASEVSGLAFTQAYRVEDEEGEDSPSENASLLDRVRRFLG